MAKMGRPRKDFDWILLDSLCGLDAHLDYCAEKQIQKWGEELNQRTIFRTRAVIERRIRERYGLTFREYREKKKEPLRISLRKKQIDIALKGNVTMLIWMGKQHLGQTEKVEQKNETDQKLEVTYVAEWGSSKEATDKFESNSEDSEA